MMHITPEDRKKINEFNEAKKTAQIKYLSKIAARFFQQSADVQSGKAAFQSIEASTKEYNFLYNSRELAKKKYSKEVHDAVDQVVNNFKAFLSEEGNQCFSRYLNKDGDVGKKDRLWLCERMEKVLAGNHYELPLASSESAQAIWLVGIKKVDLTPKAQETKVEHEPVKCRL